MGEYVRVRQRLYREDGRVLVSLTVGNDSGCEDVEFLILGELYPELNDELAEGEIGLETLGRLSELADITAAYSSACASLGFAQCSSRALVRKLLVKGFPRSACEAAVGICESRGYIDEAASARRRAELMVDKPWGRARIIAKLREEGYSDSAIDSAREFLDEVNFGEVCSRVILKKYCQIPEDRAEREKTYASLSRLGFSRSDIREAIKLLENDL